MKLKEDILTRYLNGACNAKEQELVEAWFESLNSECENQEEVVDEIVEHLDARILPLFEKPKGKKIIPIAIRVLVAAIVILVGYFSFFHLKQDAEVQQIADIPAPSGSNAIIILEDSSAVQLDDIKIGDTVSADGYFISKNSLGEIVYHPKSDLLTPVYNIVKTAVGGMTSLILADGSKVWLNANSELKFPISFSDNQREVSLKGEGYFEIERSPDKPFYVRSSGHTIKVLGTKFNVNNKSEGYISTLFEGKIALTNLETRIGDLFTREFPVVLLPNQQYNGQQIITISEPEKIIDWKNGYFDFTNITLEDAAEKMSSWYGVEFSMQDHLKSQRIYGQISRNKSLKQVLNVITQVLPITYEINENNKIVINQIK